MKRSILLVSMLALVFTIPLLAAQQAAPAEPQGKTSPNPPDLEVRTFEGELSKIDSVAKTLTVKATDPDKEQKEMVFSYDDETQVVGVDNGAQGLSGKTGSMLKISYREQRGKNQATRIEIQSKKV